MNVFDYFFETTNNLDKNFILGSGETITYKNLYNNSLRIASYIQENVGINENIILISQNSIFFISVYLGILKSGNTCIPLNFTIEQNNLDFILNTTDSKAVFIAENVLKKLKVDNSIQIINETNLNNIIKVDKQKKFNNSSNHNEVAEIIFTSGSTGIPKGVMISHQNIIANTNSIIEYLKLSSNDIMQIVLPFYYCYGLSLLHTHLRVGGSVVLNNNFIFLGSVINDLIKYKCTGFAGVPSHFQILLKKSKTFKHTEFPDLRYVTQAGGKLHDVFIEDFVNAFPDKEFYVMYGQTEATARLSFLPPNLVKEKLGSIGKGIPGVQLKVVNNYGVEVGLHEEGELIANGANIMLGYYKDPVESKKTIKDNWLYTGDIATVDNDGFIYLVARKKEIIKVGGQRISPKEIEQVILSVSQVIDCTIEAIYDDILGEAIKAIIVVNRGEDELKLKDIILKKCKQKLSLFKIPQIIAFKYNMDLKSTGKKKI